MSTVLAYLRILLWGFLAYVCGGLTIWWLGTSWWAVLLAVLSAASVIPLALAVEVPDAGP